MTPTQRTLEQIAKELGIKDVAQIVRKGLTEDQKRTHALRLNLHSRYLSPEQWAEIVAPYAAGGRSTRAIAAESGISQSTAQRSLDRRRLLPHDLLRRGQSLQLLDDLLHLNLLQGRAEPRCCWT